MADYNSIGIQGRLTRDPEMRVVGDGKAVTKFTIASNEYWKNAENNQYVNFVDCVAWGKKAEVISKYFSKGSSILVKGGLHQERWKDDSGNNKSRMVVNVEEIFFIGSRKEGYQSSNSNQSNDGEENQDSGSGYDPGSFGDIPPDDDIPF